MNYTTNAVRKAAQSMLLIFSLATLLIWNFAFEGHQQHTKPKSEKNEITEENIFSASITSRILQNEERNEINSCSIHSRVDMNVVLIEKDEIPKTAESFKSKKSKKKKVKKVKKEKKETVKEENSYVSEPYIINSTAYIDTICADMTKPVAGETLAGRRCWLGRKCNLYYCTDDGKIGAKIGTYTFHDTGYGRDGDIIRGETIDIYVDSYDEAMEWGRRDVYIEFLD